MQVRSEIQTRELEQEAEMERLVAAPVEPVPAAPVKEKKEAPVVSKLHFIIQGNIGRAINIGSIYFLFL